MKQSGADPYFQLKPSPATPQDEICSCEEDHPLLVRSALAENPIACTKCNLEVPPERIGFEQELAQELAFWRSFHDCFWKLWLDSGEFEEWAFNELSDPQSQVNTRGMEAAANLGKVRETYFWWFQDIGKEGYEPMRTCPVCDCELIPFSWALACEPCKVFVANEEEL